MGQRVRTDLTVTDGNDVEHTYEITVDFYPGSPGKLSGPPENCYPPEDPEFDLISVKDEKGHTLTDAEVEALKIDDETLEAAVLDHLQGLEDDAIDRKIDEAVERRHGVY